MRRQRPGEEPIDEMLEIERLQRERGRGGPAAARDLVQRTDELLNQAREDMARDLALEQGEKTNYERRRDTDWRNFSDEDKQFFYNSPRCMAWKMQSPVESYRLLIYDNWQADEPERYLLNLIYTDYSNSNMPPNPNAPENTLSEERKERIRKIYQEYYVVPLAICVWYDQANEDLRSWHHRWELALTYRNVGIVAKLPLLKANQDLIQPVLTEGEELYKNAQNIVKDTKKSLEEAESKIAIAGTATLGVLGIFAVAALTSALRK